MLKVTIVTVVYNNELIASAIESVINQDYPLIEYIVIDGGSKDNTLNVIKSYEKHIDVFVSEPDKGIYDAINKGINLATGDIAGILNSDDFLADNQVISRMVAAFEENKDTEVVYADIVFVDKANIEKTTRHYSSKNFKSWQFKFGFQIAHPTFYAKRELFKRYGLYDVNFRIAGDFDLLLRFLLINKVKSQYVNDIWVKMRTGGVSTSGIKSILKLNAEIIASCRKNGIYTNFLMVYSKYMVKWVGFLKKS